jgi:hypothetical protein
VSVCVYLCAKRSCTTVTALEKGEFSQDGEKKLHKKGEQEATHCREVARRVCEVWYACMFVYSRESERHHTHEHTHTAKSKAKRKKCSLSQQLLT